MKKCCSFKSYKFRDRYGFKCNIQKNGLVTKDVIIQKLTSLLMH